MDSRKTLTEDASVEAVKVYANATVSGIPAIKYALCHAFFDGWNVGFGERGAIADFAEKASEKFEALAFVYGWLFGAMTMILIFVK